MAVIQLNSYADFSLLVSKNNVVYYWLDAPQPYWHLYAPVGNDWFVMFYAGAGLPGTLNTLLQDFPKAVQLQGGLKFIKTGD